MRPSIQVVFSESDLPKRIDVLGLMQSTRDYSVDIGYSAGYTFSHISIQEFLAAYHLSLQSQDTITEFVVKYCKSPLYKDVLLYLSGLTHFMEIRHIQNSLLPVDNTEQLRINSIEYLHWIYEGQYAEKCKDILASFSVKFLPHDPHHKYKLSLSSPFDIHVFHYCVNHSSCWWNVLLHTMSSTLHALPPYHCNPDQRTAMHKLAQPKVTSNQISVIGFDVNLVPISFSLFLRAIPSFIGIKFIFLMDGRVFSPKFESSNIAVNVQADSLFMLPSEANLYSLEHFSLCGILLSDEGAVHILEAIQIKSPCINAISLPLTKVGVTSTCAIIAICKLVNKSKTLSQINLAGNSLSSESLQLLFSAPATLTTLNLSGNVMTESDVEFLSVALSLNRHLCELSLNWCGIDSEGAEHLADGLSQNDSLRCLNLKGNNLIVTGACMLADMLKENSTLETMDISDDSSIRARGAECLISALEMNSTLKLLKLSKELIPYLGHLYKNDYCNMQYCTSEGKNRILFIQKSTKTPVLSIAYALVNSAQDF